MLADEVKNMSIKEIISELGIPSELEDIRSSYKYDAENIKILEFEKKLKKSDGKYDNFLNLFGEYEEIFDKYIYIFRIAKLLEIDLKEEEKASFFGKDYKELVLRSPDNLIHKSSILSNAKNMLAYADVADLKVDMHSKKIVIELSQEYIGNAIIISNRNNRVKKKIDKIENLFGFNNILKQFYPSDLTDFFRYPNYANVLIINLYNGIQIKKKEPEETDFYTNKKYYWSEFKKAVKENIQYVNLDKMIMLYLYIMYNNVISNEMKLEQIDELNKFVDDINTLIEEPDTVLVSKRYKDVIIDYHKLKNSIHSLKSNFIDGKYVPDEKLTEIFNNIIKENNDLNEYSKEIISRILKLDPDNLGKLCLTNSENIKYLIENNFLNGKNLDKIITDTLKTDILAYLVSKDKLTMDYLEKRYCSNIISNDSLREVRDLLVEEDICKLVSENKLITLRKSGNHEEYLKYLEFYKILKLENKKLDDRILIGNSIIQEINEDMSKDEIMSLYYEELIPIELVASLLQTNVISLLVNGDLIPMEARKLFYDGSITIEMFIDLIRDIRTDNFIKIVLIFSTFPLDSDSAIRNKLLDFYFQQYKVTLNANIIENRFAYSNIKFNPVDIWKAVSDTNPEYYQKIFCDGNILFYLTNKNKYLIKKIYKNNAFVYGTPTYIINEDVFEKNKNNIIKDGTINENTIMELLNEEKIYKFVNTGWDNTIDSFFKINVKAQYKDEQIELINNIVNKIV